MADVDELVIEATDDNLSVMQEFIDQRLDETGCSMKAAMQIGLAAEEVYVNIAHYAYQPGIGKATVRVEVLDDPLRAIITFIDQGMPYDPLARQDPDVTLPLEERSIGGLGIFITKQVMDDVCYEYKQGSNILTLRKDFA